MDGDLYITKPGEWVGLVVNGVIYNKIGMKWDFTPERKEKSVYLGNMQDSPELKKMGLEIFENILAVRPYFTEISKLKQSIEG